jgi:hypothetical protein
MGMDRRVVSRHGTIRLTWGGDERPFRLSFKELRELQELCTLPNDKLVSGPLAIAIRLGDGTWRVQDIRETLRLGLVGGGMKDNEATALVRRHVEEYEEPLAEHALHARAIIFAALMGAREDPAGKSGAAGENAPMMADTPSPSPRSSESEPRSASRRAKSTTARRGSSGPS